MHSHPVFTDLAWHDDDELAALLDSPPVRREVVHEWPLSRTESIVLADGRRLAYKTQLPPSVEPAFYRSVASPLLPHSLDLGAIGAAYALATEWIDAPNLTTVDEDAFAQTAEEVARAIADIDEEAPYLSDVSTTDAWAATVETALGRLRRLVSDGVYGNLPPGTADEIARWAETADTVAAATSGDGVAHGDLTADEVFVADDGYRVIDWQRPVRGPWQLDLVGLLRSRRVPVTPDLRVYDGISALLLVDWAVLAQTELLPGLPPQFTEGWVQDGLDRIRAATTRGLDSTP